MFSLFSVCSSSEPAMATNNDGGTPAQWNRNSQAAVSVRHAFKTYGKKKNAIPVLNNLMMTVPKGTM